MLLSAVPFLVAAQSSSEIPEGLMNNPVYKEIISSKIGHIINWPVLMNTVIYHWVS